MRLSLRSRDSEYGNENRGRRDSVPSVAVTEEGMAQLTELLKEAESEQDL